MASTTKAVVILGSILVFLQVSSFAAGEHVQNAAAVMTRNGFEKGEGDTGPAKCDRKYHSDDLLLVSLTSRWYGGGDRCGKMIRIVTTHGVAVEAMVVDLCDIEDGCGDSELSTSDAVWKALGIDGGVVGVSVTWSDLA